MEGKRYCTYDGGELVFNPFTAVPIYGCNECGLVYFRVNPEWMDYLGVADPSECEKTKREELEKDLADLRANTRAAVHAHIRYK